MLHGHHVAGGAVVVDRLICSQRGFDSKAGLSVLVALFAKYPLEDGGISELLVIIGELKPPVHRGNRLQFSSAET